MGSVGKEKMTGFILDTEIEGVSFSDWLRAEDEPPATVTDHRGWLLFGVQYMFMEFMNALKFFFIFWSS